MEGLEFVKKAVSWDEDCMLLEEIQKYISCAQDLSIGIFISFSIGFCSREI